METIVALATPAGNSGVAVIRLSGEKSHDILKKITRQTSDYLPRYMFLRQVYFCANNEVADSALVVYFNAPNSYTGEDVAEIQAHGGYYLAQKIIEECIRLGASMAGPGEFSKRAFLNGKLSLDQAEGIMDLINAESDAQLSMGSKLLNGELVKIVSSEADKLTDILAEIEAKLDYPEYDYTAEETGDISAKLNQIIANLQALLNTSKSGQIIKNGVKVALVGAPNVGKSSLLNALTNSNKAIVTEIAGTTRDVIDAEYVFKGIIFRLFDTAGIHESTDKVEQIGITRAKQMLNDADIVVRVSDVANRCEISTNKPVIDVFNKSDLLNGSEGDGINAKTMQENKTTHGGAGDKLAGLKDTPTRYLFVSALTKENLHELKNQIFNLTVNSNIDTNKFYLTNARHIQAVTSALKLLKEAEKTLSFTTQDITANLIKSAWQHLGEITGTTSNEAIIDRIFSKFCLGK